MAIYYWNSALTGIAMLAASIMVQPTVAQSKVILKERVTYYNVQGRTGREVFESMLKNGPKLGRGIKSHALATTQYDYDIRNIDVKISNGRCVPVNLDVYINVTYTYPRWTNIKNGKPSTRAAWKRFSSSVQWHEKQHVKIAMQYAEDYEDILKKTKLKVRQNCDKAPLLSKWKATSAALRHNRLQKRFDRKDLRPGGRGYEAQIQLIRAN